MAVLRLLARIWLVLLGTTTLVLVLAVLARWFIPLTPWASVPTLLAINPPDGAVDVRPRDALALQFGVPMNRASVEQALSIEPPVPGDLLWSPDAQALTLRPAERLTSAMTYTVRLDQVALSRWWRPLEDPVEVVFRTAVEPAVLAALPKGDGIAPDTALALVFSQPMVAPDQVQQSITPTFLQLEPSTEVAGEWLDQFTLLIRPLGPLLPATDYTVTVAATLTDLRGIELGTPVSWAFATRWPVWHSRTPEPGASAVTPRTPLSFVLDAPVPLESLRQALVMSPTIEGELATAQVGATQVVTFTPTSGWAYGTSYAVQLGDSPSGQRRSTEIWRFQVEPQPRLIAFFPGQGQILPPEEAIRLIFSTPMDATSLEASVRFEPPVADLALTTSSSEVLLRPELEPSTLYTLTVAADARDRNGEPLGTDAVVSLRTAPAPPSLTVPDAFAGLVSLEPSTPATLDLAMRNLSGLNVSLYPLDQPALLRFMALRQEERAGFVPERYGQAPSRIWRAPGTTGPDQLVRQSLPIGLVDGDPLDPGAYYVRLVTPEGPRADLVVLVNTTRLLVQHYPDQVLIWASDRAGTPRSDLPVALFRDERLVARGRTDANGTWIASGLTESTGSLLALTEDGEPAVVQSDWRLVTPDATRPSFNALLFPDQPIYHPGETITVTGFARQQSGNLLANPPTCRLQLRQPIGNPVGLATTCQFEPTTGLVSGTLVLSSRTAPGPYRLAATLGDAQILMPVRVVSPGAPSFELNATPLNERELEVTVQRNGLPPLETRLTWSLTLEAVAPPTPPDGFVAATPALPPPLTLTGAGQTDAQGRLTLSLPASGEGLHAMTYVLLVTIDGQPEPVMVEGVLTPGRNNLALRLPRRLVATDQRSQVEVLVRDGRGQAVANVPVQLEVFRAGNATTPVLTRQMVSDADGLASTEVVQLNPGEYNVLVRSGTVTHQQPLWVYGQRFIGWSTNERRFALVTDRERYQPGDLARLLIAAPVSQGNILLTIAGDGLQQVEVLTVQPGQVFNLPITAAMAPGIVIGAVIDTDSTYLAGTARLLVDGEEAARDVRIASSPTEVRPGASVALTLTTSANPGQAASDLLVTLGAAEQLPNAVDLRLFAPEPSLAPVIAAVPPQGETVAPARLNAPQPQLMPPSYRLGPALRPDGETVLAGAVDAPTTAGTWRLTAYAFGADARPIADATTFTTTLPIATRLIAPVILGPTDEALFDLALTNTSPFSRTLTVRATTTALELTPVNVGGQTISLAPGEATSLAWQASLEDQAHEGSVGFQITGDDLREQLEHTLTRARLLPDLPQQSITLARRGALTTRVDLGESERLSLAFAPGLRAALATQAEALAQISDRSNEEVAALALIAAGLASNNDEAEAHLWADVARTALAELEVAQASDGGWGWWPGTASEPFVTAFALEAQLAVRTLLNDTRPPDLRAISYLGRVSSTVDIDTRAYLTYVLHRAGRSDPGIGALRSEALEADGLAFLALTLPANQAVPLIDRLGTLALREPARPGVIAAIHWNSEQPSALPRSPTAITGAVTQALRNRRPGSADLPGASQALLEAWTARGWPSAYDAARVAVALLPGSPATEATSVRLTLDGVPVLDTEATVTRTVRTELDPTGLATQPELRMTTSRDEPYLLAYQLLPVMQTDKARLFVLEQALLDPTNGAPLDPANLQVGQLISIRLTTVIIQPTLRADLRVKFPAGIEPLGLSAQAPWIHAAATSRDGQIIRLGGTNLVPGVYTHTITGRARLAGRYSGPEAQLEVLYEPEAGVNVTTGEVLTLAP